MTSRPWRWGALVVASLLFLAPAPGAAQQIQGIALGPEGDPLPEVSVALHRVGDTGGATTATTRTDADGRFTFEMAVQDSSLYFAAMRYQDRLYIGPAIRGGVAQEGDYTISALPANEAGRVADMLSGGGRTAGQLPEASAAGQQAGPGDAGAIWLVALLALTAAAIFLTTAPEYRRRRGREALVELATIENRLADPAQSDETDELRQRRDALRERLTRRA